MNLTREASLFARNDALKNSVLRRSHTHISHLLTDFRAKERLLAVYAKDCKGFLSPTVIVQPRPQGAFPWLWRWEKRPGDEVAHRCYSLCTDPPPPSPLIFTEGRGVCTQAALLLSLN